jgi:hypothetical protein
MSIRIKLLENSLIQHIKNVVLRTQPFFHVDFTKKQIEKLLHEEPHPRFGLRFPKVAGICVVSGVEFGQDVVYAFRVEWGAGKKYIERNPNLNVNVIKKAMINDIATNTSVASVFEQGQKYWRQDEVDPFIPDHPLAFAFVFIDRYTLLRMIHQPNCEEVRIRKTMINSKQELMTAAGSKPEKFTNYIIESLPSFEQKITAGLLLSTPTTLNDQDVMAYSYGYPCPPKWKDSGFLSFLDGITFIDRNYTMPVANDNVISMGAIVDALFANVKARELLVDWKLINRPVIVTLSDNGVTDIEIL